VHPHMPEGCHLAHINVYTYLNICIYDPWPAPPPPSHGHDHHDHDWRGRELRALALNPPPCGLVAASLRIQWLPGGFGEKQQPHRGEEGASRAGSATPLRSWPWRPYHEGEGLDPGP